MLAKVWRSAGRGEYEVDVTKEVRCEAMLPQGGR
jgi:hypothetical protein